MIGKGKNDPQQGLAPIVARLIPGLLVGAAVSLCITLLQLAIPLYTLQVFLRVLSSHSIETLVLLTVIVLVALVAYRLLEGLRQTMHLRHGEWLGRRLKQETLAVLVRKTLSNDGEVPRSLKDVADLETFVAGHAFATLFDFLWSPLFFVVLALLHPAFALVAAVGALLMVLLGVVNEIVIHKAQRTASEAAVRSNAGLSAALRNAEAIEAMGMLGSLTRRWRRDSDTAQAASARVAERAIVIRAISTGLRLALQVTLIATAAYLVITHETSAGSLMAVMILSNNLLSPFGSLIDGWAQWVHAAGAYRRVDALLKEPFRERSDMALPAPRGGLAVERLIFVPPGGSKAVLQGVTFAAQEGEAVCVLGPSASGKSTLMRLLVGIWPPTAGSVKLGGHEVYSWNREDFGRHVGYLPQDVELFSGTVRENIARMAEGNPEDVVHAAKAADIHGMIGGLPHGYDTPIGPGGYPLTGGQRQRIALARALYGDPALLVLDEPDASLDADGQTALRNAIQAARARGAVIFVVTHRSTLLNIFDKALVLNEGRVSMFGDRAEILRPVEAAPATPRLAGPAPEEALGHG